MPIRALLFDLDDTLLETHTHASDATDAAAIVAADLHPGLDPQDARQSFLAAFRELEQEMHAGEVVFHHGEPMRTEIWRRALAALGRDPLHAERLGREYLEQRRRRYRLFDDVEPHLAALGERYALAIVTNGLSDIQRGKIAAVGLERWAPHITISFEAGGWKPDPVVFRHALEQVGGAPSAAVMIGDNPIADIAGAQALGMRAIWMRRWEFIQGNGVTPDATVRDMAGLVRVLDAWEANGDR